MARMESRVLAICTAALFFTVSPANAADSYTSAQFLKRSAEHQAGYIDVAVQIAGVVAAQNNGQQARCIDDWYLGGAGVREQKVKHITEVMKQYPDHHPGAVVVAVLQKACGSFNYVKP